MTGTDLIFRTDRNGLVLAAGVTADVTADYPLGINVVDYPQIRVALSNREGSVSPVTFRIMMAVQGVLIAPLEVIQLLPTQTYTSTYDVPGITIRILAESDIGLGANIIDVIVYGYTPYTVKVC